MKRARDVSEPAGEAPSLSLSPLLLLPLFLSLGSVGLSSMFVHLADVV